MHDDDRTTEARAASHGPGATSGAVRMPGPRPTPGPPRGPDRVTDDDPHAVDGSTGDGVVDAALARLTGLDVLPVREHVAVFDAVHAALQGRLADVED